MSTKTIVKLSLTLVLLGGMIATIHQATAANAQVPTEEQVCEIAMQAGNIPLTLSGNVTLAAVSFNREFCTFPIVTASGGEHVDSVQIGVVTTHVAWFLVYGEANQETKVYWQAMEPTQ